MFRILNNVREVVKCYVRDGRELSLRELSMRAARNHRSADSGWTNEKTGLLRRSTDASVAEIVPCGEPKSAG
jgi:hypothetical protein